MRATGFFYSSGDLTYLVTARHNILPTYGQILNSGEISLGGWTKEFLPTIDVYLRTSQGFDVEHLDIREVDGVKHSQEIDVLGIPIDLDPQKYRYRVWNSEDIASPRDEMRTLDVIGFDGVSFPENGYEIEKYSDEIGFPAMLKMTNEMSAVNDLSKYGLMAVGFDETFVGDDSSYNGLSGAPVLGNGLVGIHSRNAKLPSEASKYFEEEYMNLIYWRAEILSEMLK